MSLLRSASLVAILMVGTGVTAQAATECREDVDGNVTCHEVAGDITKDSATTTQETEREAQPSANDDTSAPEPEGGTFGDSTSQSREHGITY